MTLAQEHPGKTWNATACFIVASLLDFLMTCSLLSRPVDALGFQYVEGNPVAGYFLVLWGMAGLAGFKIGMVALIASVCWMISSRRAVTARRILEFGTFAGSIVVIYSAFLSVSRR